MTQVIYVEADGTRHVHDLPARFSVMEGALRNGVPGIEAECGGCVSCATCHVYVDEAWADRTGEPDEAETEMLDLVEDRRPTSRLSCQISLSAELDGLVVHIPESQSNVGF